MVRWGIIATGSIANKFAKTVSLMGEEAKVIACASRSVERAKEFADQYGIEKYYGSYEELVQEEEVDAVYISTPNNYHFENMKMCIEAGKAVLCEKPFTTNAEEAKEIFALAREKGVFVMEAFWVKMMPLNLKLQELLKENVIGQVKHVRAEFGFVPDEKRRERKLDSSLAGGALLDIGIYNLGFAGLVFGLEPKNILSSVSKNEFGTDEYETLVLEYGNGKTASLTSAIGMAMPTEGVIYGTEGKIYFPNYQLAEKLRIERYDGTSEEIAIPFEINGFEYQIREVAKGIKENQVESNLHPHKDTLAMMDLMDRIRSSWDMVFTCENK